MKHEKAASASRATWGPPPYPGKTGSKEEQHAIRVKRLANINATHLRNAIPKNDETAIEVASHIGRYISDITLVDIIRDACSGNRYALLETVRTIMEESIAHLAEEKAIRQIERYST